MTIAVLGAGNWGTTVALLLNRNGHEVRLWEFYEPLAHDIISHRENRRYLKGFPLPESITITWSLSDAVHKADVIACVVPSSAMRGTAKLLASTGNMKPDAVLVSLSKGLEHDTMMTMTDIIEDEIQGHQVVALSGPCIATEVAHGLPTTIVSASVDNNAALSIQDCFMNPVFRVYTSDDPRGIQLGGALKNIIAIAAGINDGLGFGTNAKSAITTRGIVEMTRLGVFLGAKPETFNGLSGIGDLMTTCFSPYSRNRHIGEELGKGKKLETVLSEMVMVAEGVPTTKAVYDFARERAIEMPISEVIYKVLFEEISPQKAVEELMMRERKSEHIPIEKTQNR